MQTTHEMSLEIIENIFRAEHRRLATWINGLCRRNREAYGDPDLKAFIYSGKVYKHSEDTTPDNECKRRGLHSSLIGEMASYDMDKSVLGRDGSFISQALFTVLDDCRDVQEVRDALPNCLSDKLQSIQGLSRTRPEAFTILDNPRALRQYQKILPRIELDAATSLIY
jgi:hypothetical protein